MPARYSTGALIVVIFSALAAGALDLLRPIDNILVDAQFRVLRQWFPRVAAHEVVVVAVDEDTVRAFPEPLALWHRPLSQFLAALATAKPAALGIDIVLPDRSFESVMPGSDKQLLQALLRARTSFPLVLAVTVDEAGKPRPVYPPFLSLAGDQGWGYALFPTDADGRVRRFDERLGARGETVPTLAGQLARRLGVEPAAGRINYWLGAPFQWLPLHQVLKWADSGDAVALKRAFGGKPVLLGTALPFTDRASVPIPLDAGHMSAVDTPGVLLHAQALRTLLAGEVIHPAPRTVVVAAAVAGAFLWFVGQGAVVAMLLFVVAAGGLFAAATAFIAHGLSLPIGVPLLSAALALGGRSGFETALNLRERRRLRRSFAGYVSPAVMAEILAGRVQPQLGGSSRFVCVMFSDIRGYTTRTEGMSAQATIGFLNRYFERVVAAIHAHGGTVTSFMGDGVMALFGAPNRLDHPCRDAIDAGRDMLRHVAALNESLAREGMAPIEIGVGLDAGEAVIGHVGASTRHDYTAIGDVVNVASRIESLTKETAFRMVVSGAVARELRDSDVPLTKLGPMAIKGHTPVEVYGTWTSATEPQRCDRSAIE
jgi:class 3 adenylate cyclase